MISRCWDLVFSTHREPWFGVELGGAGMALAGGQVVGHGICRVNRHSASYSLDLIFLSLAIFE